MGAFHLTGNAGFAGDAVVADCWNARFWLAIAVTQFIVAY